MSYPATPATPQDHFDRRIGDMKSERTSWDPHWKALLENFSPRRGSFFPSSKNRGDPRNDLINNTPLFAKRVLRSGMMTGITSPARPWFRLAPPDPGMESFGAVREWLDTVERLMYRIYASSNLYHQLPLVYDDAAVVGTTAMIQEEDYDTFVRFSTFNTGEFMLDINGKLRVDTFAREYELSVYQLVQEFGLDNVSEHVKQLWDASSYTKGVTVRHIIEPVATKDLKDSRFDLDDEFTYRSVYYEKGERDQDRNVLRVKGYKEFPIVAPRWDVKCGDIYGYSAGMDALGDARALQVQEREKGKAVAKMVSPPTKAPSSLKQANISLLPGANTFVDDPNDVFSPIYQVNPDVTHLAQDIKLTEERINRAFFVDLFMMISHQDTVRTATEIASREEEKLVQLGPVLESMHGELLDPLIDRTFSIIMREAERGWQGFGPMLLPPPPPELAGSELKVDYISVLAQAQKLISTGAMERWVGFTGQMAQFMPDVLDLVNGDELVTQMGESLGVSTKVMRDADEVAQMRQARAQQEQQMAAMEQMQQVTGAAKDIGGTVRDLGGAATTSGTALGELMGGITGQPPQPANDTKGKAS